MMRAIKDTLKLNLVALLLMTLWVSGCFFYVSCTKEVPVEIVKPEAPEEDMVPFRFSPLNPELIQVDENPPLFCIPKEESLTLLRDMKDAEALIERLQEGYR